MELVPAMCPNCKEQIKVNPSEQVVFCKLCNNAFKVTEAINLYSAHMARRKAALKPSDEIIEKFDAILKQDYKLAQIYLDDIIKKEYPDCSHLLICPTYDIENNFEQLYQLNPYVAKMRYKLLCKSVNSQYYVKRHVIFNGQLAFFKLFWLNNNEQNFKKEVEHISYMHISDSYDGHDLFQAGQDLKSYFQRFEDSIKKYHIQHKRYKEFDDDFIAYVIKALKGMPYISHDRSYSSYSNIVRLSDEIYNLDKRIADLILLLEDFYTPARKELEKKQREEEKRLAEERKYKQALNKEVKFWQQYIDLLKAGKAKKAKEYLEKTSKRTDTHNAELAKFKKGLFGVKYTGDVSSLQASALAEQSLGQSTGQSQSVTK